MMACRVFVAVLICQGLQSNEAAAVGRSEVHANMKVSVSSLEKAEALVVARSALASSEADGGQLAVRALASAEAQMKEMAMSSMTIPKALEIVSHQKGATREVMALIQQDLGQAPATGYSGVQKGQDMLNEMIQETMEKLDLERQTCYTFITSQKHQIWVTIQDIRMYDATAAEARENVLAAQTEIERLTQLLPQLTQALEAHERKCADDIADIEAQLKIVLGDIEVMGTVLKLTECKESLLQHNVVLGSVAGKVGSEEARRLLEEGIDEACSEDMPLETPESPEALLQISANPTVVQPVKQREKCTLSDSSCKRLRDKFLQIQSGIEAKRDELLAELATLRRHCADEQSNLESQISDAEGDLKSQQTALAKATKEQNEAEANSKLKNEERTSLINELERMEKLCKVNIANFVSEECALGKIRGQLEKMKGHTHPAFLQDCEVTDWSAGECSASCSGGSQKLTRAVSVHPVGGSKCPPLEMERKCNEDACPIDCELEDWSEWGDCSAECNGGVKEKIRNVLAVPQFAGEPCGETSMADSCNIGSCDKDCVVSDWTGWSECSKACDSGLQTRVKNVVEAKKADGKCAEHDDETRLEYHPCNEMTCNVNVTCESQVDVVILLDGSGSLGAKGWEQTKKAGEMLVNAFHGGESHVKVSVILFSGPTTWSKYYECTGFVKGATPDLKTDCGIFIAQHFTGDMKAAADVIKGLSWPAKSTLTSQALLTAKTELSLGRKDANSVVVVVTDGRPLNAERTTDVAKQLRKSARLIWVPVTTNVPIKDVRKWASKPVSENVIQVADFNTLSDPATIDAIIADMCPKVGHVEEPGR